MRPAWKRQTGHRVAPGCIVTPAKLDVLERLAAAGERGSCAMWQVMPGGTLAALSQFGLAERAPDIDSLGGCRYRINDEGRALLARLGRTEATP